MDKPRRLKRKRGKIPSDERIRKEVACTECKKHKIKCIGGMPCDRCVKRRLDCLVQKTPKITMSQKEMSQKLQALEYLEKIVKSSIPDINLDLSSLQAMAIQLDHRAKAEEVAQTDSNDIITDLEIGSSQQVYENSTQTYFEDAGSNEGFVARIHEMIYQGTNLENAYKLLNKGNRSLDRAIRPSSQLLQFFIQKLPPRDVALHLITSFLEIAKNNNYFYFDDVEFLNKVHFFYRSPMHLDMNDTSFLCIFLMSLCMGSIFAYAPCQDVSMLQSEDRYRYPGWPFYLVAKSLCVDVLSESSIETVQTFFLLGMYILPTQAFEVAYIYLGIALRAAIANGMHRTPTSLHFPNHIYEVRNRLFWSVYCIERKIAIALGRPETLALSDISIDMPRYCHLLDSRAQLPSVSTSGLATSIALITNRIHDAWSSTLKYRGKLKLNSLLGLINDVETWRKSIPVEFEIANMSPADRQFRGMVHIMFSYYFARITIGRPFFLLHLRDHGPLKFQDGGVTNLTAKMVKYCYSSAAEIVDLLLLLKDHNKLFVYSYSDYCSCHMAAVMICVYLLIEPCDDALRKLDSCMEILQLITDRSAFTEESTKMIKSLKQSVQQSRPYCLWLQSRIVDNGIPIKSNILPVSPAFSDLFSGDVLSHRLDASLEVLGDTDWFSSILADHSYSLLQDSSIESMLFPLDRSNSDITTNGEA